MMDNIIYAFKLFCGLIIGGSLWLLFLLAYAYFSI